MTQMKRWGQVKGDVDYKPVAKKVFLTTDAAKVMKEMGMTPPATPYQGFTVMGKPFDPAKPNEYVDSFSIRRVWPDSTGSGCKHRGR